MEKKDASVTGKKNYRLNNNQLRILILIYKFRYVSIPLMHEYLGLKYESTIRRVLQRLESQGYVASIFDTSFIRAGKPAYYFLSNKGIGELKSRNDLDQSMLHAYYKNKYLSEETMQHYLDMLAVCNALNISYGDSLDIFTKNELGRFDEFPGIKPDMYLRNDSTGKEYFLTLAHDVQPFLTRKRFKLYVEHSEEDGWLTGQYPTLLYVFKSSAHESQFLTFANDTLESMGISNEELPISTTTFKATVAKPYEAAVWTFVGNGVPRALE